MGDKGQGSAGGKLEKMAKDYYNRTKPIQKQLVGNYLDFLGGDYDVTSNPAWGAGRNVLENQYDVARENTIAGMPTGGGLMDALSDLESDRAQSMVGLASQIAQDEYNKLYGMTTMAPQQSFGALSNLAGQQAMAASQQRAGLYDALGDVGMGAGILLGSDK